MTKQTNKKNPNNSASQKKTKRPENDEERLLGRGKGSEGVEEGGGGGGRVHRIYEWSHLGIVNKVIFNEVLLSLLAKIK